VPNLLTVGCGLITLRVCVFRPSRIARIIGAEKIMGRLFMASSPVASFRRLDQLAKFSASWDVGPNIIPWNVVTEANAIPKK
jgi:hypothetical protein